MGTPDIEKLRWSHTAFYQTYWWGRGSRTELYLTWPWLVILWPGHALTGTIRSRIWPQLHYLSIHQSTHPPIHPLAIIHPSSIHPSFHSLSLYSPIHPLSIIYPPSIYPSSIAICLSIYHLSIHQLLKVTTPPPLPCLFNYSYKHNIPFYQSIQASINTYIPMFTHPCIHPSSIHFHLPFYLFTHPSFIIFPSIFHPSTYLSIHSFIQLSIYSSINSSSHAFTHPSPLHPSPFYHSFIHSFTYPPIHSLFILHPSSIHLSVHPFIHSSIIHVSIYLSTYLPVHPLSIHLFICLSSQHHPSIHLSIYSLILSSILHPSFILQPSFIYLLIHLFIHLSIYPSIIHPFTHHLSIAICLFIYHLSIHQFPTLSSHTIIHIKTIYHFINLFIHVSTNTYVPMFIHHPFQVFIEQVSIYPTIHSFIYTYIYTYMHSYIHLAISLNVLIHRKHLEEAFS